MFVQTSYTSYTVYSGTAFNSLNEECEILEIKHKAKHRNPSGKSHYHSINFWGHCNHTTGSWTTSHLLFCIRSLIANLFIVHATAEMGDYRPLVFVKCL